MTEIDILLERIKSLYIWIPNIRTNISYPNKLLAEKAKLAIKKLDDITSLGPVGLQHVYKIDTIFDASDIIKITLVPNKKIVTEDDEIYV